MKKILIPAGAVALLASAIALSSVPSLRRRPGRFHRPPEPCAPRAFEHSDEAPPEPRKESVPDLVGSIDLQGGEGAVRGQVRDTLGAPLVDAVVTLFLGEGERSLFSDEGGTYEFRGIPEGSVTLVAEYSPSDERCVTATAQADVRGAVTVDLVLDTPGSAVLWGRFLDRGLPPCEVQVHSEESAFQAAIPVSAEGLFLMEALPMGPARVRLVTLGKARVVLADQSLHLAGTVEFRPSIDLSGRRSLDLEVVGPEGEPMADAEVAIRNEAMLAWGRTDEEGILRLEHLVPQRVWLQVVGGGLELQRQIDLSRASTDRWVLRLAIVMK